MGKGKNGETTAITDWSQAADLAKEGFKSLSRPEILKLREMPDDKVIDCTITGLQKSNNENIRQPLFEAKLTEDGREVLIPAQASIANQLLDKNGKCPHIGKRCLIRKSGSRTSNKWKDEKGNGRQFSVYQVLIQG
jgi:hypothetical protein